MSVDHAETLARLRLVVFDWDGTLIDSEGRIVASMQAAINAVGLPSRPRSALSNVIGLGLREALADLYPDQDEARLTALVEAYRHQFVDANPVPMQAFEGARESLEWLLDKDLLLAVATGKARHGLERAFDESGFRHFFQHSRCADEAASKPDPQMLQQLMQRFGVEPRQTLMIGDTEYDMEMAARAGSHALAVGYGVHALERLLGWPHLGHLDAIADLPRWWRAHAQARPSAVLK